jgi:glutaredoxin
MDVKNLEDVPAFTTADGSEIRELLAHRNSAIRNQSLAEARVAVGGSTLEHFHPQAEEIYFITAGRGRMRIEGDLREVAAGAEAQDLEPRRGNAAVSVLLRARLRTQRHGDHRAMKTRRVRIFIKSYCGWCHQALDWLDAHGIKYEKLDVLEDAAARKEMQALSGQTLAPVIEVDGKVLADFDVRQLEVFWRNLEPEAA